MSEPTCGHEPASFFEYPEGGGTMVCTVCDIEADAEAIVPASGTVTDIDVNGVHHAVQEPVEAGRCAKVVHIDANGNPTIRTDPPSGTDAKWVAEVPPCEVETILDDGRGFKFRLSPSDYTRRIYRGTNPIGPQHPHDHVAEQARSSLASLIRDLDEATDMLAAINQRLNDYRIPQWDTPDEEGKARWLTTLERLDWLLTNGTPAVRAT